MTTKPVAEIVAELRFHRVSDHSPTPHYLWLVYREGHGYFHAMPCYGMHNPWWVPRNNITGEESSPIDMLDSDLWSDGIPTFTDRAELTRLSEENIALKKDNETAWEAVAQLRDKIHEHEKSFHYDPFNPTTIGGKP